MRGYRDAYLHEPAAVDERELTCRPIMDLLDACGELGLEDGAWLPVVADLQGRLPLAAESTPAPAGASAARLAAFNESFVMLAGLCLLALSACSQSAGPQSVPPLTMEQIPGHDTVAQDNSTKEPPRLAAAESYMRTYLMLFGNLTALQAQAHPEVWLQLRSLQGAAPWWLAELRVWLAGRAADCTFERDFG